jgi:hypothetical protein
MNAKYKLATAYDPAIANACEIALVRLMLAFATHKHLLRLVGGLVPRYLAPENPPHVPRHAGTTDVDVVLNIEVLIREGQNYSSLRDQLRDAGFSRLEVNGRRSSWQWICTVGAYPIVIEFLQHTDGEGSGTLASISKEDVSACRIAHVGIVQDWFEQKDVTVELEDGVRTETIRFADAVSFTVLKALAYDSRGERKDAADLHHVLQYAGDLHTIADRFTARISEGRHRASLDAGFRALVKHFCTDENGEGYRKSGPGACAAFGGLSLDRDADAFVLACRNASGRVAGLLRLIERGTGQDILPMRS